MAGKLIDEREGKQTSVGLSPVLGGQQVRQGGHGLRRGERLPSVDWARLQTLIIPRLVLECLRLLVQGSVPYEQVGPVVLKSALAI